MKKFLERVLLGDPNKKYLTKIQPIVDEINGLEAQFKAMSDEQLRAKTDEFKKALADGKTLDDILPQAFAVVRETATRTLDQRHYDVQLLGGIVLHRGEIAEMRTGEGKTLTSTLAVYLNALEGKGVHLVTVNDYLSKRDAEWMGQIYFALGLSVAAIGHDASFLYTEGGGEKEDEIRDRGVEIEMEYLQPCTRKEAYAADITYGTNNEFGFDYLRDNMARTAEQMVQRELNYSIVDEVDSILIDEARTPLIISAPDVESTDKYYTYAKIINTLVKEEDYNVDEKRRASTLTQAGITKVEKALGVDNLYVNESLATVHHIEQALKALSLFHKDKEYVVKEGEIIIVDEFTGRLMPGRRYSQGLHQAIEAKEGVNIQRESKTLATITFQNYFRIYKKLAGMTGTAYTEAEEFGKIYGLDVTVVPTNEPLIRKDSTDKIYKSEKGKFEAVIKRVKELNDRGQPVLVGTVSIEKNEMLSQLLTREGITHNLLNAKNHEKEAAIIAQAGKKGAVTIATNMAGRGVDIILGGNPSTEEEGQDVIDLGGLYVIGTERHDSRRIDNQLRGRSGRQGNPGGSQFYVSAEDEIMRVFGSDRMKNMMNRLGLPEDVAIENKIVSKSLEESQKRVETYNYDQRKHVVEYDDVLNKQRQVIYDKRRELLIDAEQNPDLTRERMLELVKQEIEDVVTTHTQDDDQSKWNFKEIYETVSTMFALSEKEKLDLDQVKGLPVDDLDGESLPARLSKHLYGLAEVAYKQVEQQVADTIGEDGVFRKIEKQLLISSIDALWVAHLDTMDSLRASIGLRGYGQRDPLVEYKKEGFRLFHTLLSEIQKRVVYAIFKVRAQLQEEKSLLERAGVRLSAPAKTQSRGMSQGDAEEAEVSSVKKVAHQI